MSDDSRRVLELLAQGKVSVDEAHQLINAVKDQPTAGSPKPRFIRIHVHKPGKEGKKDKDVNIRVPLSVVRSGMRLGTFLPGFEDRVSARLRERGMDINLAKLDPAVLESIIAEMGEVNIDVNGSGETVRITCE